MDNRGIFFMRIHKADLIDGFTASSNNVRLWRLGMISHSPVLWKYVRSKTLHTRFHVTDKVTNIFVMIS